MSGDYARRAGAAALRRLTEAHGPGREMFGLSRVVQLLGASHDQEGVIEVLLRELASFTGPTWEREDDITLVTVGRTAAPPGPPAATSAARSSKAAS